MTHSSNFVIALLFVLACGLLIIFYNDRILLGTTLLGAVITIVIYIYNRIILHKESLFKQPPPNEDCPICMLPLPSLTTGSMHYACCGKVVCSGCIFGVDKRDGGGGLCPFCRTPAPTSREENIKRNKKRLKAGNANAAHHLGTCYADGSLGLPQDHARALELYHQAAELGCAESYTNIGNSFLEGNGVERDLMKAQIYWELAAKSGQADARHNLGCKEYNAHNYDRALTHYMIAVRGGDNDSLDAIQLMLKRGHVTKDDYAKALVARQAYLGEIRSPQRDEAAAFGKQYKYY